MLRSPRLRSAVDSLIFLVLGFLALLLAVPCGAQTRSVTETAAPEWSSLTCTRNADASVECFACVAVSTTDGETKQACGAPRRVTATVNINRANGLAGALRARALVPRFAVDAGAEP